MVRHPVRHISPAGSPVEPVNAVPEPAAVIRTGIGAFSLAVKRVPAVFQIGCAVRKQASICDPQIVPDPILFIPSGTGISVLIKAIPASGVRLEPSHRPGPIRVLIPESGLILNKLASIGLYSKKNGECCGQQTGRFFIDTPPVSYDRS